MRAGETPSSAGDLVPSAALGDVLPGDAPVALIEDRQLVPGSGGGSLAINGLDHVVFDCGLPCTVTVEEPLSAVACLTAADFR